MDPVKRDWLSAQVKALSGRSSLYASAAETWERVLRQVALRLGIEAAASSRPKSLSSFAEETLRKYDRNLDPLERMTDLWSPESRPTPAAARFPLVAKSHLARGWTVGDRELRWSETSIYCCRQDQRTPAPVVPLSLARPRGSLQGKEP